MNELESEKQFNPEKVESRVEKQESGNESEENVIAGAQMLETPPDGGFFRGLQHFIAWVKSLVAPDK